MTMTINQSDAEWFDQSVRRAQLISKYRRNEITGDELKELNDWLDRHWKNRDWFNQFISRELPADDEIWTYARVDSEKALKETLREIEGPKTGKRVGIGVRRVLLVAAAAVVVAYILLPTNRSDVPKDSSVATTQNDARATFHEVVTVRGKEREVTLEDGSQAHLNAASSIHYPTSFAPDRRLVEMTGEIYFEAKTDATRPFTVTVNNTTIEAVGTKFNVNAYGDNGIIRVSLVEGKLYITTGNFKDTLISGQEVAIVPGRSIRRIENSNINEAISWTKGYFIVNDVVSLQKLIERRYDVEVILKDTPAIQTKSAIPYNRTLETVLQELRELGIQNTMENGKVIIH